jgi:hypothetical protein
MKAYSKSLIVLALAGTLPLVGCLERKEKTTVHADGSVHVALSFKGDAGEFAPTAAEKLPTGAPWTVHDEDVARSDGKGTDHVRTADADFASAGAIPETFGSADDPAPLHAKTTVTVEHTKEGRTRWTFERRYAPRAHAWRDRIFNRWFPDDLMKALQEKDEEGAIPDPTLRRAAAAVLDFEREKALVFLEDSLASVAPEKATPWVVLQARQRLIESFDKTWKVEDVVRTVKGTPEERTALETKYRDEVPKQVAAAAAFAARKAIEPSFDEHGGELGLDRLQGDLTDAFERFRRIHDATEQLQVHSFEVRVELPGRIVLSDADTLEDDGKTAVWKFGGKDLNDRTQVLRAVAEN